MNTALEYVFAIALFVVFTSLAALVIIFYGEYLSKKARQLRARLKTIEVMRKGGDSASMAPASAEDSPARFLAQYIESKPIKQLIDGAAVAMKPAEFVGLTAIFGVVGLLIAMLIVDARNSLSLMLSLALPFALGSIPLLILRAMAGSRRKKFDKQFPEALGMMSRALQAGGSLTSAMNMVANEITDPCGAEFKKTMDEINFGIGFGQAATNMADRIDSPDVNFFVTALTIQRDTGGNLSELLNGLAHTIRERQKLAQKVKIISAEGRLSGNILIALPLVMAVALTMLNPEYMDILWSTDEGRRLVYVCLAMMATGAVVIRRIVIPKT